MKIVYYYSEDTKEFLYDDVIYKDPEASKKAKREVYSLPENATYLQPPQKKDGYAIIWVDDERWNYIEDHRGTTLWKSYDESMVVTDLGPLPTGWSTEQPDPPPPTLDEMKEKYTSAINRLLNETARLKDYDNAATCVSYMNSTNEDWATEAQRFNTWRDQIWETYYQILADMEEEKIDILSVEALIDLLPEFSW